MPKLVNPVKQRLESGGIALGAGIKIGRTADIPRIMKTAGFDFLFIDLEHGSMSLDSAAQLSVAALDADIAPLVRVPNGEYSMATRILDSGAMGIVMPHVENAEEARTIVDKLRYPPAGHRSVSSSVPHFGFEPMKVLDLASSLNDASLIVAMLETPEAIKRADEIAAVPGIDVLMVGTNDLCAEMNIHGDFGSQAVVDAYKITIEACRKNGKWPGMGGVYNEELMGRYVGMGMRFLLSGLDLSFLMAGAKSRTGFLRSLPLSA